MEREKRAIYPHHGRRYDTDPNKFYIRSALKCADGVRSYLKDHPAESELTLLSQLIALQQTELWCPMATKFFQNHNAD